MINHDFKKKNGGLYLVVDPKPGKDIVLPKVKRALQGGVDIIQLWDNWSADEQPGELITAVCEAAHDFNVPVLIHERWIWMNDFPLDGIHLENAPDDFSKIQTTIQRPFLAGITCGNDEQRIQWAIENKLDYISFCSMYPSSTANSCELVRPALVKETCRSDEIAVYVAGGITIEVIPEMLRLGISGVAVVSAIMKAEDPAREAALFKSALKQGSYSIL